MFFDEDNNENATINYILECAFENIGKLVRILSSLEDVEGVEFNELSTLIEHQLAMTRICYLQPLIDMYSKSFDIKYEEDELKRLEEKLEHKPKGYALQAYLASLKSNKTVAE